MDAQIPVGGSMHGTMHHLIVPQTGPLKALSVNFAA